VNQPAISPSHGGNLPALGAALLAVALWASSFAVMKHLLAIGLPPLAIVWLRMIIAAVLLAPFLLLHRKGVKAQKGDFLWLLLLSLFEPGLYFLLEITALQYTSSAQAGIIVAVFPLLAAAGGAWFFREPINGRIISGLLLAVAGAVLMTLAGKADAHAPNPLLGNTLEFLAILSAVGYMLIVKKLAVRWPVWIITAFQMTFGAIFFLPGAWALADADAWQRLMEPWTLVLVVYLGAGITVLAYGFYNYSISRLSAAQAGIIVNLLPVLAALLGWWWLGERLNGAQMAAAGVILAGVLLAQQGSRKAAGG